VKCPIFLPVFNQIWKFCKDFHKSPQYQIPWKSIHWGHRGYTQTERDRDRWTDMTKVIGALRDYAQVPKRSKEF
jgi:hypothetical protein